jgi:hypothetical protein
MKLSLLIDSSKIDIDNFYKEATNLFKDINYELIFLDNGENKDRLIDLYNKDLLHIRIIYYSGNIDDVFDKSIRYCSGEYICVYDNNYEANRIMDMINYLDEHKECDYYRYEVNVERNFSDKIKRFYPTHYFLMIRNIVVSFRCLIGYNGIDDNLDMTVTTNKIKEKGSYIGKTIGFDDDNLL